MLSEEEIKEDILFVKQILTKWQLSGYVSEEVIDKIDGILHYSEQLENENKIFRETAYWEGYIQKQNEAIEICKQCKYIKKVKQLESDNQKLIETNDKYLQKLVFALTPTTHELSTDNNNAFKQIIADNIDLETCKIKRKLKEYWGVDKY